MKINEKDEFAVGVLLIFTIVFLGLWEIIGIWGAIFVTWALYGLTIGI